MRTTLTIDDQLLFRLKELAQRRRASFKETVETVLRRGLAAQEPPPGHAPPFRTATFRSAFKPGVDPLRLNQLADDLETEDFGQSRP